MRFEGFPPDLVDFYEGLAADNSKAYWTDHRETYETAVRAPMEALLGELSGEFGSAKFFRPYRDVRFSKDKSPYKTAAAAVLSDQGMSGSGYYFQVSADGLLVAGGYYSMAGDQVERYRQGVADERAGPRLERIVDELSASGFGIYGDELKRPPRGFDADAPRLELLKRKNLHSGQTWPPDDVLHSAGTLDRIRAAFRRLAPLNGWLDDVVGPSTAPPSRR